MAIVIKIKCTMTRDSKWMSTKRVPAVSFSQTKAVPCRLSLTRGDCPRQFKGK